MLRPLIAIDLNSNVGSRSIARFVSKILRVFGIADVILDDESIVEFNDARVFSVSDPESVMSLTENLRKLSEKKDVLDLRSAITLKRELGRSLLIVVSDRKIKKAHELIFKYNGRKVQKLV
ncbi:MAG: hypothetical protein QW665_04005 [Metallosphaera sp.]